MEQDTSEHESEKNKRVMAGVPRNGRGAKVLVHVYLLDSALVAINDISIVTAFSSLTTFIK